MAKKKEATTPSSLANSILAVLPGDNVTEHVLSSGAPKIGTGLRYDKESKQIYSTLAGSLEERHAVYFVRQTLRRYRPALEDRVIGIVEDRLGNDGSGGDIYRINIGASHPACLSNLDFEGATKRNKPNFQTGQVLYARISALYDGLLDPQLSCQLGPHDGNLPRKDWMTNEGCYGELRGGTVSRISTGLARELLHPSNLVLNELAKSVAFEVAIGVNGFLWIHSRRPEYTIMIQNAIQNSQVLTDEQVRGMVKSLVSTVEKQILQQEMDDDDQAMEE